MNLIYLRFTETNSIQKTKIVKLSLSYMFYIITDGSVTEMLIQKNTHIT